MRTTLLALALTALITQPALSMTLTSNDIKDGQAIPAQHFYPPLRRAECLTATVMGWPAGGDQEPGPDHDRYRCEAGAVVALDRHRPAGHIQVAGAGCSVIARGRSRDCQQFRDTVYAGPCRPTGSGTHHYQLTIWAMPTADVAIAADAPAKDVIARLSGSAVDHASMTASVQR